MDLLRRPKLVVSTLSTVNTSGIVAAEDLVTGQGQWSLQQNREL